MQAIKSQKAIKSDALKIRSEKAQQILASASALLLEGGLQALSVRAIATHAGISTIGIYSHFRSKQGVLDGLYVEGFERVCEAMAVDPALLAQSAQNAVRRACENYLDNAERFQAHYRLIFGEPEPGYEPSAGAQKVGADAFGALTALVAHLLPSTATKAQRHDAALQIWSVLHGFVGLRQHAVAQLVEMQHWRKRALQVIDVVIAAIAVEFR